MDNTVDNNKDELLDYAKQLKQDNSDNGELLDYAKQLKQENATKNYVSNKLYQSETPEPTFVDNVSNFLGELNYHRVDIMKGVASGALDTAESLGIPISDSVKNLVKPEAISGEVGKGLYETVTGQHTTELLSTAEKGSKKFLLNTGKFIMDAMGETRAGQWLDNATTELDNNTPTESIYGTIGELTGQIGTGLVLTRGMGGTKLGRAGQAFLIDFLGFDGDSKNIFNMFDEHGVDLKGITDVLKSDENSTDMANRLKNGFSAVMPTVALDYLVDALRYGNKLIKERGQSMDNMTPDEIMKGHIDTLKTEADNVRPKEVEEVKQGELVNEVHPDIKSKLPESFTYNTAVMKAVDLLDSIPKTANPKKTLNATKMAPDNQDLFSKVNEEITANVDLRSNQQILNDVTKELKDKLGDTNYNAINDMLGISESTNKLTEDVARSQVITASLFEDYRLSWEIAKKEMSASSILDSAENLINYFEVAEAMKNTGYNTSRALNILNNRPKDAKLFNTLKVNDSLDLNHSIELVRNAVKNEDVNYIKEFMEDLDNEIMTVTEHIQKAGSDGFVTKFGNVLSELQVGNLLTSPASLQVNVLGGFYIKHQRLLLDTYQFLSGKIVKGEDSMKWRTLKNIYRAAMINNKSDFIETTKLLKHWFKGGLKDEAYDEMVHIRYNQDQEFSRKFVSAPYIRGSEIGERDTVFNSFLNVLGIQTRSSHKVLGAFDNYYKLGFFRTELAREAGKLADKLNVSDEKFAEFASKFEKANMELHLMRNNGINPSKEWKSKNKLFIGGDIKGLKYADQAMDYANKMTFQKELEGATGKIVTGLNSNGYLRTIIPFKTTPINILYEAHDEALGGIYELFKGNIKKGGLAGDLARARLFMSGSILTYLGYEVATGQITGFFKPEERKVAEGLRMQEYSKRFGDIWVSYQQVEPLSTILGIMTGVNRVWTEAMTRPNEVDLEEVQKDMGQVMKELFVVFAHNLLDKSYAKGVSDLMDLLNPEGKIKGADYTGNIVGNAMPFSGLTTWVNREFGDGYVNETSGFVEKAFKRYEWLVGSTGVDIFGEKRHDVSYMPWTPLKASPYLVDIPENVGAKELFRLGVEVRELPKAFVKDLGDLKNIKIELSTKEYVDLRELKSTKYKFKEILNNVVNSDAYQNEMTDQERTIALQKVVSKVNGAMISEMYDLQSVKEKMPKEINKVIRDFTEPKTRPTYNDMFLEGVKQ